MWFNFLKSEDGAATVDFVILTAAVAMLAVSATLSIFGGIDDLGERLSIAIDQSGLD